MIFTRNIKIDSIKVSLNNCIDDVQYLGAVLERSLNWSEALEYTVQLIFGQIQPLKQPSQDNPTKGIDISYLRSTRKDL